MGCRFVAKRWFGPGGAPRPSAEADDSKAVSYALAALVRCYSCKHALAAVVRCYSCKQVAYSYKVYIKLQAMHLQLNDNCEAASGIRTVMFEKPQAHNIAAVRCAYSYNRSGCGYVMLYICKRCCLQMCLG